MRIFRWMDLYLSFLKRVVEFSSFFGFPRSKQVPYFFLDVRYYNSQGILVFLWLFLHQSSSSSSCLAISTDISDLLTPPLPIVHCFWQVLRATSRISTELLYGGSSTSHSSKSLFLLQCPAYLVRLILIVFVTSGRWPYSCFFCGVLSQGLVQYCLQHFCVIAVKFFFLYTFS